MKKAMTPLLVASLILAPLLCLSDEYGQQGDAGVAQRKDPILAGALSWYVPGLGQMYSGAIVKGAAFFVVEEALLVSTILTFAEIKLDFTGSIGLGINIKSRSNPDREDQKKALIFGISLVAIHFLNVIDAVNTTRKYNRSQDTFVSVDADREDSGNSYSFAVNKPF
jgi:TM2 domain-containing membrane protein YozV